MQLAKPGAVVVQFALDTLYEMDIMDEKLAFLPKNSYYFRQKRHFGRPVLPYLELRISRLGVRISRGCQNLGI